MSEELDKVFADLPDMLTAPAVAKLLGMTNQGVYNWLNSGKLPGYKLAGNWFILRDELKAVIKQGANRSSHAQD